MKKIQDEFTGLSSGFLRWKARNPEAYRKSERERKARYIKKNPLRNLLKNVKQRAKKEGIEFSLSEKDLDWPEYCPVLGVKLIRNSVKGWAPDTHSIDRIDSSKGYVTGNVKIISWRANDVKGNATIEELEKVLAYMKTHLKD